MMLKIAIILTISATMSFCWPPYGIQHEGPFRVPPQLITFDDKALQQNPTDNLDEICEVSQTIVELGDFLNRLVLPPMLSGIAEAIEAQGSFPKLGSFLRKIPDWLSVAKTALKLVTTTANRLGCYSMRNFGAIVDYAANTFL